MIESSATKLNDQLSSITFEAALEQLQLVVKQLESGELSLDQALQAFERGVSLTRTCQERLVAAEQKVELLMKIGAEGEVHTQPFLTNR